MNPESPAQLIERIVRDAALRARRESEAEPEPHDSAEPRWPVSMEVGRGLEGALACSTRIGYVNGAKGWLVYRGYNCFELAERSSFEETAWLLLHGTLPSRSELEGFRSRIAAGRRLPGEVRRALELLPLRRTHPMAALRTAVSVYGACDPASETLTLEGEREFAVRLIGALASMTGMIARLRAGAEPLEPDPALPHAADFLRMMTGAPPDELAGRMMDVSLILHADHGMNASTFTTMVANSSLSDMASSVVAGICSLKGPLHGGANEQVLYALEEIGGADRAEEWFARARREKRKLMGFGHRVYKAYDPRARVLGPLAGLMAGRHPEIRPLYETACRLEEIVCATLGREKKIFPNVDFYSGLVYRAMGIETAMFTPIFAVSRVAGWTARTLEYLADNRLFRPRASYVGPLRLAYVPLDAR